MITNILNLQFRIPRANSLAFTTSCSILIIHIIKLKNILKFHKMIISFTYFNVEKVNLDF